MRPHKHVDQWNKLDTAISDAISLVRGAQTARVLSKKGSATDRDFKFFANTDSDYSLPKTITSISNKYALSKSSKFDLEITTKTLGDESKMTPSSLTARKIGTFNFLDDEAETSNSPTRMLEKSAKEIASAKSVSLIKKKVLARGQTQNFVITTKSPRKIGMSTEIASATSLHSINSPRSANQMDKTLRSSEPICGIDEMQLRLLFRKKCEVY